MKWIPEQWSGEAATRLGFALGRDEVEIKRQVDEGEAVLWRVPSHGFIVTRLENCGRGNELVLIAWAGVDTGPILEHAKTVCRAEGISSIRFHTEHPEKLASRFVSKWGFEPMETVYQWVNK